MDCLDRTNVVQSVVSRWVLNRQLREIGILGADEKFESFDQFESLFRNGTTTSEGSRVHIPNSYINLSIVLFKYSLG